MFDSSHLDPLVQRRSQIAKRLADLESRASKIAAEQQALSAENENIEITLQTLARFGIGSSDHAEIKAGKVTGGNSSKPEDTPTLYEMVTVILREWDILDTALEGQFIYEEIKRRWWPDAPRNNIFPSLWRFASEGRLVKDGTRYGLVPKDETPGASTPSASSLEVDLDDEIPF